MKRILFILSGLLKSGLKIWSLASAKSIFDMTGFSTKTISC